jgi:hypothetical protein
LLDRELVDRRFDDAEQTAFARRARAQRADGFLAEGAAARAVSDALDRERETLGESLRTGAIPFEHVERHALRGFRADAGQATQRVDEVVEERRGRHALSLIREWRSVKKRNIEYRHVFPNHESRLLRTAA